MRRDELYARAIKMVAGLQLHEALLGVKHVTRAVLNGALGAARAAETEYQTSRHGKKAAVAVQAQAKASGQKFATDARDILRPVLGGTWSVSWAQAGFKNDSLRVPEALPTLLETLRGLKLYFTNNPDFESPNLDITAAVADQRYNTLDGAITTVGNCKREQRTKRDARATAEGTLLDKIQALEKELSILMPADDPRWIDFVDAVPADPTRPDPVQDLVVEGDGPGRLGGDWGDSARADRYFVEIFVVGVDTAFRRVMTVQDSNADIENLTPGATVRVRVVAVNDAGESAPSAVVEVQVPALADAA